MKNSAFAVRYLIAGKTGKRIHWNMNRRICIVLCIFRRITAGKEELFEQSFLIARSENNIVIVLCIRLHHNVFTWEMHIAGLFSRGRSKNPLITRRHTCKYKNATILFSLIRPGDSHLRSRSQLCDHDLHF